MADDIDIEEHDVLDNPRIKNIFPDITSIKTEPIDYDEEENIDFENDYETYQCDSVPEEFDDDYLNLYQNKIILGSKPCNSPESSDEETFVPKILESSVVLEDWGAILLNSPCYCRSCQILFPTENALDSHKMTAHSFLVAVRNNKAIKSTSKSAISARLLFESDDETTDNFCNHCNQRFPDEIALLKHSYELLPRKFACEFCDSVFDNEAGYKSHKIKHSNVECLLCPICTCHFKYTNKLITHLRSQHQTEIIHAPERIATDYKCAFCSVQVKDNRGYNTHIFYRHSDLYNKKPSEKLESDKFKCLPCNLTFPSAYSEKIHRVAKHMNIKPDTNQTLECKIKTDPNVSPKKLSPQTTDFIRRPIPKSTLFKCNKCQIHFVSCLMAVDHSKRCVLKKGDWKCKKCRRSFKQVDRQTHLKQHEVTERFKIIEIRENILNKILCRCTSCKVCFDERTLLKYHSSGCTESNYVQCSFCNFRVHEHGITKHKRLHTELGSDQFFTVDFVCVNQLPTKNLEAGNSNKSNIKGQCKNEKFYYYCPTCQCFMKVNKLPDKHSIGKCKKDLTKCLCKLCGLRFSIKSLISHKKEHKKYPSLKLRDLTFKNTQSGKKINPPFPDFKKCTNCNVRFFSYIALKNHVCNVEEAKTCGYCNDKFSDLAYKLHVPFHEYSGCEKKKVFKENISEIIKKYESLKTIWNILFLCETCDTILDSYDDVVEHSQNHFCNMESYNVTISHCIICNLKIVGQCYEKHKQLHLANTVTKDSFEILTYKYDTLLTENWYDMFKTLAKDQVDQIINKSKYKHTRSVRMELLVDGPIDITFYQCGVCNLVVDWSAISDHAQNSNNCANPIKFKCSKCHLNFPSKNLLTAHGYIHDVRTINNKTFRIITFNNQKDLYVNDSLRSKMNPEGLKFIRCQSCGKLINKAKYKKHIEHHKYYKAKKKGTSQNRKNQPKFLVRPKFKKVEKINMHNFYKCKKCSVCVFKHNVHKHFCSSTSQKKRCSKCFLWFRSSHIWKHYMYHEKYKLTKKNVNVYLFKDGKIDKDRKDSVTLYQCSDCSVCLHQEMNIKRHICISENYQKTCELCEVPFYCSRIGGHLKLHNEKEFSKKNIVIKKFKSNETLKENTIKKKPFKTEQDETSESPINTKGKRTIEVKPGPIGTRKSKENYDYFRHSHIRFFKCTRCKLLFITPTALLEHINSCPKDSKGVKCTCGLIFHDSMIELHKNRMRCPNKSSNIYIITVTAENSMTYDETKCLFHCSKCDIYYLTFRAIFNHFKSNHVVIRKASNCDSCNILLSMRSIAKHKLLHHRQNNLTMSDLLKFEVVYINMQKAVEDLPNKRIINYKSHSKSFDSNEHKYKAVKRKHGIEESVIKKQKLDIDTSISTVESTNSNVLYNCEVCDLNFLHMRTLEAHQYRKRHDDKKFECPKCDLKFTQNSLTRHLKIHLENPNYIFRNIDDEEIVHEARKSIETDKAEDDKAVDSEVHKPNIEIDKVEDVKANFEVHNIKTNNIEDKQTNNTNKLYKCSDCDVYFLLPDACSDHVSNHITLDPTEYIACKICDLQFLCEYLGAHMKSHREKTFNIDNLIVEEYQINDGKVKIDTYSAADRLKSKLVTTTTHFDTEDEKGDKDETIIDSTITVSETKSFIDGINSNPSENDSIVLSSFFSTKDNSPKE